MQLGLAYWIIMLVWLVFGVWNGYTDGSWRHSGGNFIFFILLLILGWKVFGAPIQ